MSEGQQDATPPIRQARKSTDELFDEYVKMLDERIEGIAEAVAADELAPVLKELEALKERVSKLEQESGRG